MSLVEDDKESRSHYSEYIVDSCTEKGVLSSRTCSLLSGGAVLSCVDFIVLDNSGRGYVRSCVRRPGTALRLCYATSTDSR